MTKKIFLTAALILSGYSFSSAVALPNCQEIMTKEACYAANPPKKVLSAELTCWWDDDAGKCNAAY